MLPIIKRKQPLLSSQEKAEVIEDVYQAERELEIARWRFNDAVERDQVDYSIYALEAAEKKLDMLLRKAKYVWQQEARQAETRGEDE